MRLRTRTILIALCFALVAMASATGSASARPFSTGVLDGDVFYSGDPLAFQRTENSGAKYVKVNLYWNAIAPNTEQPAPPDGFNPKDPADPNYSWGDFDEFVKQANSHNLEPVLDVVNAPRWARNPAGCTNDPECAPKPAAFASFATALAERYSGDFTPTGDILPLPRVKYFQTWVEVNHRFFFKPGIRQGIGKTVNTYRTVLNRFYNAIHAVKSNNVVISSGLAPIARPGTVIGPLDFMRRLLCMTGKAHPKPLKRCRAKTKFDVWATHPYTTGGPTHASAGKNDVSLGNLPDMNAMLRAADKAKHITNNVGRIPFWATEFSWDSNPPDPGGLKPSILARWSAEAQYRMYKAGLDAMFWFGLRDEAPGGRPHNQVYDSGLYLRGDTLADDTPKRVLKAFRFPAVALTAKKGFIYWGRTPNSKPGKVKIQLRNGGGSYRTVKTVKAGAGGIFSGLVKKRGVKKNGNVRVISGNQTSLGFSLKYVKDFHQPPFG